jgi:hypothetical protein
MTLAGALAEYRTEVICDLAETYQIFDYRRVPGRLLGTLVAGLGAESRLKKVMFGIENDVPSSILMACILDDLEILKWQRTEDGAKGRNVPERISAWMLGQDNKTKSMTDDAMKFRTGADFEAERARILEKINDG